MLASFLRMSTSYAALYVASGGLGTVVEWSSGNTMTWDVAELTWGT